MNGLNAPILPEYDMAQAIINPARPDRHRASGWDVLQSYIGLAGDEGGYTVARMIREQPLWERNSKLRGLIDSGKMPINSMDVYAADEFSYEDVADSSWGALAKKAKEMGFDIETDEEIYEKIAEDIKWSRAAAYDVLQRAPNHSFLYRFGGEFIGTGMEPIYYPAYFVGLPEAAAGARLLTTIGRAAGRGAAVEVGLEAGRQPFVFDYKTKVGDQYDLGDAFFHISMAAGFGAAFGTIGSIPWSKAVKRLVNKTPSDGVASTETAKKTLNRLATEAENPPDSRMTAQEHLTHYEVNQQRINNEWNDTPFEKNTEELRQLEDTDLRAKVVEAQGPEAVPELQRVDKMYEDINPDAEIQVNDATVPEEAVMQRTQEYVEEPLADSVFLDRIRSACRGLV